MLVTGGTHAGEFFRLLGNGHEYGIDRLFYAYQERPGGIAEALGLAERFVGGDRCCVLLADNVFERPLAAGRRAVRRAGARRACRPLRDRRRRAPAPSRRRGARRATGSSASSRSRPSPPSRYAVTGAYFYDETGLGDPADARAVGPRRARDHRPEQLVRRAWRAGGRRDRRLLGRRGRVDRRPTTRSTTSSATGARR